MHGSVRAGHSEVAEYLLEAGAVCNEYTFDGDRCHYAALTPVIRALLRQYEQRPPPLAPLAADLRTLTPLCDDLEAPGSTARFASAPDPIRRASMHLNTPGLMGVTFGNICFGCAGGKRRPGATLLLWWPASASLSTGLSWRPAHHISAACCCQIGAQRSACQSLPKFPACNHLARPGIS